MIGAGSSGITACQNLAERGVEFTCFEKGSAIGGNWKYMNDNGMSSAYRSLHINTSREMMQYEAFPMPADYPDYPGHAEIAAYFEDFVDHFGLRDRIEFGTEVVSAEPCEEGWEVTVEGPEGQRTETFTDLMVCNGHHWAARWPEPAFPGSDSFTGEQMHAHDYKTPEILEGKRVVILGIGNSATDIAVESSRLADRTILAMRRGAWIVPKYLFGIPTDMYRPFRKHMESIGLAHKRNPHILRHTRASHLLQEGVSLFNVAKLLGDTVATVERVYGHFCPDYMAETTRAKTGA